MKTHTAIIVDDDLENIRLLKFYLKRYCTNVEVLGEATNVNEAIDLFNKHQPEILYLDVELEDNTSFNILDSIDNYNSQIIFVTSYKKYALKAIEYAAVDYVLKPIKTNDLIAATSRAISRIKQQEIIENNSKQPLRFVAVPSVDKIDVIPIKTIVYCEADGKYTRFIMKDGSTKMASRNLGEYEKLLAHNAFFRIHHHFLVNIQMITSINKASGYYCEMVNDITLPIAKRRFTDLSRYLKIK